MGCVVYSCGDGPSETPALAQGWRLRGCSPSAGVTALAVLLAALSDLVWPPVAVTGLGTLPALYLAWLAVPGVRCETASEYQPKQTSRRCRGILAKEWFR